MTGEDLYDQLRDAATKAGKSLSAFVEPVFPDSWKIEQLRIARNPTRITVDRVEALLAGKPIPPPRTGRYFRDERAFGLSRAEAEDAGIPPSGRSVNEGRGLQMQLARKRRAEQLRDLSDLARETRRPGQCVADRLGELRRELAA